MEWSEFDNDVALTNDDKEANSKIFKDAIKTIERVSHEINVKGQAMAFSDLFETEASTDSIQNTMRRHKATFDVGIKNVVLAYDTASHAEVELRINEHIAKTSEQLLTEKSLKSTYLFSLFR